MKVDAAQKQIDQIAFFCSSPSSIEFRKKIERKEKNLKENLHFKSTLQVKNKNNKPMF